MRECRAGGGSAVSLNSQTTCNTLAFSSKTPPMRAHIVIIGAGISGLTAAITIGEGIDKLIAAGETIARPEMTLLDAANWIGGRARTDELSPGVSVDAGPHWFHGGARTRSTNGPAIGITIWGRSASIPPRGASMSRWKAQWRLSSANGR